MSKDEVKVLVYLCGVEHPHALGDMAYVVRRGLSTWEELVQAMIDNGDYEFVWDSEAESGQ